MTRIKQGPKPRGSQHWIQVLASQPGTVLQEALGQPMLASIHWLSPLAADDYAEYRDQSFLDLVGLRLEKLALKAFWPSGGPVWDGLALTSTGAVLLVEAKANLPELASPGSRAGPRSAAQILASLGRAKASFGATADADWFRAYYQYANRLAWLHLLRGENDIDAYLVFLYFCGASEVKGPASPAEWRGPIDTAHRALALGEGPLSPYALEAFIDVSRLADA